MAKGVDPIARFNAWFKEAQRAKVALPEAMVVATSDLKGRVSARWVLLKEATPEGFVFFTNTQSPKGRDLVKNPYAALVFYWDPIGKQVRISGHATMVTPEEADAYWVTRPRQSCLAAVASSQSESVASRTVLLQRLKVLTRRYRGKPVPRPPHWSGYRVHPEEIEFWRRRAYRLHERELFVANRGGWKHSFLQP